MPTVILSNPLFDRDFSECIINDRSCRKSKLNLTTYWVHPICTALVLRTMYEESNLFALCLHRYQSTLIASMEIRIRTDQMWLHRVVAHESNLFEWRQHVYKPNIVGIKTQTGKFWRHLLLVKSDWIATRVGHLCTMSGVPKSKELPYGLELPVGAHLCTLSGSPKEQKSTVLTL